MEENGRAFFVTLTNLFFSNLISPSIKILLMVLSLYQSLQCRIFKKHNHQSRGNLRSWGFLRMSWIQFLVLLTTNNYLSLWEIPLMSIFSVSYSSYCTSILLAQILYSFLSDFMFYTICFIFSLSLKPVHSINEFDWWTVEGKNLVD